VGIIKAHAAEGIARMKKPFTLYGRPGSGSLAVQVVLEESAVPYERVWVGSETADVERFRKINPTGRVPALELPDGTIMFESAAMLIHLALQNAEAKLAPQPGTSRHATFLQWMIFMSANIYESALRTFYSSRYSARGEEDAAVIREQGTADYGAHLSLIGRALNPCVLGADYSLADVYLYMLASWYPDKDGLFARVPALGAHAAKISSRPAVVKVEADHAQHG
jgi:glutathione S-transferase